MSVSYSQKDFEKKNQVKALVITLLINTILFLLIWQVKIWNESPTPKLPDINEAATGEISFEQEPPAPMPPAQQEVTQTTEPEQANTVPPLTSDVESPVTVKKTPVIVNKEIKEAEPVIDLNLTMGKRSPRASAGGTGSATGTGTGTGNGNSTGIGGGGNGKGTGAGNGEGKIAQDWTFDSKSLNGIDNGSETGEITFFIRINDKGNVTEIRIDRRNVSGTLAAKYMRLIRTARFYPKSDGISRGASGFKTIKIVPTN